LGALPESTQLTGCAEGRELLTLFLTQSWHPSVTTVTSDHPVPCCLIASTCSPSVYSMYSPFPFLSICLVAPPIGERVVRSVSLYDYLICFLSRFRLLYVPVPIPLLIRCLSVIRLSHLPYLLSAQCDCARHSSVIPTPRTSPHPFYLV